MKDSQKKDVRKVEQVKAFFKNSNISYVLLPPLVEATEREISFYSWLKLGYLFYKYDKDSRFGYIEIPLKKDLTDENKSTVNKLIKEAGFVPQNETKKMDLLS